MRHFFEAADAARFLNPHFFYVGASYNPEDSQDVRECQLERFYKDQIWENGFIKWWSEEKDKDKDNSKKNSIINNFNTYTKSIQKGDMLFIKRLNGKGSSTMRILGIGIALGRNLDQTIRTAWVMQNLNIEVPLACVGTISPAYTLDNLPDVLKDWATKARAKFLKLNLNIEDRYYT